MVSRVAAISLHSGLQRVESLYGRHGFVALTVAVDLHLVLIGAYLVSALLRGPEPVIPDRPIISIVPGPPMDSNRPWDGARRPQPPRSIPPRKWIGKPVITETPFEDSALAQNPQPIDPWTSLGEMDSVNGDADPGRGDGPESGTGSEAATDTSIFPFVERPPVPVTIVNPDYPEDARRLGLEGTVSVKVLVEKDGRVSTASIVNSTNAFFDRYAERAARKWVFVPGMMTSGPVRVWTVIPFRFKLSR